jgi:hypothetical protein
MKVELPGDEPAKIAISQLRHLRIIAASLRIPSTAGQPKNRVPRGHGVRSTRT